MTLVGDLVSDDQVVGGVHHGLDIVADHARALTVGGHGAGVRIGEGYLAVGGGGELRLHRLQLAHLAPERDQPILDPSPAQLGGLTVLTVRGVERLEVARDTRPFASRQTPVFDPAVLTISKITAGTAHNIIPSSAELLGTLRSLSETTRTRGHEAFVRIVEHVAAAHGMTGRARVEAGFPVTVNDARATAIVRETAMSLGGEAAWHTMGAPLMGAEDFSYVLQKIPGAMSFIGVAPEGGDPLSAYPLHNTRIVIDEATMARGVAMHCACAERFLDRGFDT